MTPDEFLSAVVREVVNPFILLLVGVTTVVFLWGVIEMISNANDPTAREKGKNHMIWGIIGFVIMFGVYGILQIVLNTFGITPPSELTP